MAFFRFSRRAEADLLSIGAYTLRTWGEGQTGRYLDDLESGLRRMEQGRHVIFYRQDPGGILISRILHQRMLLERHALEPDDDEQ